MATFLDDRQIVNRAPLSALGNTANLTLDVIMGDINTYFANATNLPTASVLMLRDANGNTDANSFISSLTSTATAGTTTTLTVASTYTQIFTGTATQTVVLPAANTLTLGQQFFISNQSTGSVQVNANGGGSVQSMATSTHLLATVTNIGSSAGTWDTDYTSNSALINPMSAIGQMIYGGPSGTPTALIAGTSGQILQSNGAGAPSWVSQSSLSVGGSTNISGGLASEIPYQTATGTTSFISNGASGQVLTSNGTSAPTWNSFRVPQISYFYSSSSSPYVTPAGALYLKIRMVGGGGGGGGSSDSTAGNGAGGGAGGYLEAQIIPTPLQSFAFSVGTGGAGGNNSVGGQNGTTGVSSTFAGGSYIAPGGGGGGSSLGANNIQAPVGLGGSPSSGDFNVSGGNGSSGSVSTSGNLADALGGNGGSSFFGGGGIGGVNGGISPTTGSAYGSGGGGGGQKAGAQAGADGAPGAIIVEAHFQ